MTKQIILALGLSLLLVNSIGCGSVTIDTGEPADRQLSYNEYYDGWIFGMAGEGKAGLDGACPNDRISKIRNYFSFEDILISVFTVGIYSPHTSTITCAKEVQNAARN